MVNIASLGKVQGVTLNSWFIPTMFAALELDNSFVMWSNMENEYYINTVDNILMVRSFNRVRRSFPINIVVSNNKILLTRNISGDYYASRNKIDGFRKPRVGDSLMVGATAYLIDSISGGDGDNVIELNNNSGFINSFNGSAILLHDTGSVPMYTDTNGVYYTKHYRSDNPSDIYIDGEDIRGIAGAYM